MERNSSEEVSEMKKYPLVLGLLALISLGASNQLVQAAPQADYEVLAQYERDDRWFTQGLEVSPEGQLLMSTGQYGDSVVGVLNLETGQLEIKDRLDRQVFGEGLTQTPDAVWQITYKEGLAYKRDPKTLTILETFHYEGEGWGLAYDASRDSLWMTNGSTKLQERDAKNFELKREVTVTDQGKPVKWLNELEFVDGKLYGNIWQSPFIVKLDPETGVIESQYDFTSLIKEHKLEAQLTPGGKPDVLNGIAHIEGDRFYVTGKYYPYVFEVRLK